MKQRKKIWRILLICAGVVFALCIVGIVAYCLPSWLSHGNIVPSGSTPSATDAVLLDNPIDFATLKANNPETVAWIKIPGTIIDYPVMRSGIDREENFYINHNSEGKPHRAGAIYMQKINRADFSDPNTVLYGHNMGNGSMFSWLHQYKKKAFFNENRTIIVYTPEHILTYDVYAAFLYDDRHILNSFDFYDKNDYAAFLEQAMNPPTMTKQVRKGVNVTTNARIITLSTCDARDNNRYLVVGVLTNDQRTK